MNKYHNDRIKHLSSLLKGLKVEEVKYYSDKECKDNMWYTRPVEIILEGGFSLIPVRDDECNDGGVISTNIRDFELLYGVPVGTEGVSK